MGVSFGTQTKSLCYSKSLMAAATADADRSMATSSTRHPSPHPNAANPKHPDVIAVISDGLGVSSVLTLTVTVWSPVWMVVVFGFWVMCGVEQ